MSISKTKRIMWAVWFALIATAAIVLTVLTNKGILN